MGSPLFSSTLFSPLSPLPVASSLGDCLWHFSTAKRDGIVCACVDVCRTTRILHSVFFQTANCSSKLLLYLCGWCGRVRGWGGGSINYIQYVNYTQYVCLISEYVYRQTRTRLCYCLTRSGRGDGEATLDSMFSVLYCLVCLSVAKGLREVTGVSTVFGSITIFQTYTANINLCGRASYCYSSRMRTHKHTNTRASHDMYKPSAYIITT